MKQDMYINILGHCEKCDHLSTRNVKVKFDDAVLAPCECPSCHEGTVYFEKLAVHHRMKDSRVNSRLLYPSRETFRRTRSVFLWGMLAIGLFVMLAAGIVLRSVGGMAPLWKYLLIAGLVLVLILLWIVLCKLFDRASTFDWESPHARVFSE